MQPAQEGFSLEHLTLRARHTRQAITARRRRLDLTLLSLPPSALDGRDGLAAFLRGEIRLESKLFRSISGSGYCSKQYGAPYVEG
jgi:hypothetical protein